MQYNTNEHQIQSNTVDTRLVSLNWNSNNTPSPQNQNNTSPASIFFKSNTFHQLHQHAQENTMTLLVLTSQNNKKTLPLKDAQLLSFPPSIVEW